MMATHIERMLGEFGCARHLVLLISLLLLFLITPFVASVRYGTVIEERRWGTCVFAEWVIHKNLVVI